MHAKRSIAAAAVATTVLAALGVAGATSAMAADDALPAASPTPTSVVLPLMKETKKPPKLMKPMASTYPATAERQAANSRNRRS